MSTCAHHYRRDVETCPFCERDEAEKDLQEAKAERDQLRLELERLQARSVVALADTIAERDQLKAQLAAEREAAIGREEVLEGVQLLFGELLAHYAELDPRGAAAFRQDAYWLKKEEPRADPS